MHESITSTFKNHYMFLIAKITNKITIANNAPIMNVKIPNTGAICDNIIIATKENNVVIWIAFDLSLSLLKTCA
jgi:hypothetical protein